MRSISIHNQIYIQLFKCIPLFHFPNPTLSHSHSFILLFPSFSPSHSLILSRSHFLFSHSPFLQLIHFSMFLLSHSPTPPIMPFFHFPLAQPPPPIIPLSYSLNFTFSPASSHPFSHYSAAILVNLLQVARM